MDMNFKDDVSIVLAGQAGQGIETIEAVLTRILKFSGYNVFATKEYMSRVRLGQNSTEIRISSKKVASYVHRIDVLVPLDVSSLLRLKERVTGTTVVLCDAGICIDAGNHVEAPVSAIATEIGNKIFTNTVAIGLICGLFGIDINVAERYIKKEFSDKKEDIVNKNTIAVRKGHELGSTLVKDGRIGIHVSPDSKVSGDILVNGAEAIALGAVAGGCNFIGSYPMSPSTAVLISLAEKSRTFDIIAEQAEDEIAAINMAIGAWYAGARAMVTTSGGGFALMTEGISLSGMVETPVVVHVAQRPGPATGLPTRTEQGDLDLVLHAGHGAFPRIILAPGTIEDGFFLTQAAFNLADKYQVPVFILSDQYYVDSYYNLPPFALEKVKVEHHVVRTTKDYKRYAVNSSGISPRGIPGHGDGLVFVDSDEHDEDGHITEDATTRKAMVDKRLRKLDDAAADMVPPVFSGGDGYSTLLVSWGSTFHAVQEAIKVLQDPSIAHLHFTQVYPLHPSTAGYLKSARKTVAIEGNATAQLARLIKVELGITIDEHVLKYTGEPFSVEELAGRIKEVA